MLILEPTTGMDPVNRRYVWSFIENFKKDRVVILTTHSMEEAEVVNIIHSSWVTELLSWHMGKSKPLEKP